VHDFFWSSAHDPNKLTGSPGPCDSVLRKPAIDSVYYIRISGCGDSQRHLADNIGVGCEYVFGNLVGHFTSDLQKNTLEERSTGSSGAARCLSTTSGR
jgi:hypothetical protein